MVKCWGRILCSFCNKYYEVPIVSIIWIIWWKIEEEKSLQHRLEHYSCDEGGFSRCPAAVHIPSNHGSLTLDRKLRWNSDDKAETTVHQNQMHLSQQPFFDLLVTHICMPLLPSVTLDAAGVITHYHNCIIWSCWKSFSNIGQISPEP